MTRAPRAATILGWCGVSPFVALAGATALQMGDPAQVSGALRLYGAIILSFMGGVHWGIATKRSEDRASPYVVSVLPALWAFAMAFPPAPMGLAGMAVGFAALVAYDLRCVRQGDLPQWYGRLRLWLTTLVCLCLVSAAVMQ